MTRASHILIGTVGYHNLRNHSIGPLLLPAIHELSWPAGVRVEELNWGPVAIAQRLQAETPPFDRIVLLSARPSEREEGTVALYRWAGGLPEPAEVQARVGESVTGVISVDNLLVVGQHLGVWPPEVYLIDVAPGLRQEEGEQLSPQVAARIPLILKLVRNTALFPAADLEAVPLRGEELAAETRKAM